MAGEGNGRPAPGTVDTARGTSTATFTRRYPLVATEGDGGRAHDAVGKVRNTGKATFAVIVAVVALLGSFSSLLFSFVPQLKPDPRDSVLANLNVFGLQPDVSLLSYLQLTGKKVPASLVPQDKNIPGDMVFVRTEVDGYKHRGVFLKANLFFARSQRLVPPRQLQNPFVKLGTQDTLDTPHTTTMQVFWFPELGPIPATFLRVEMFDGSGRMLAVADSPVIHDDRLPLPRS